MRKNIVILRLCLLLVSVSLISVANSQTCPSGLVSYWRMDETDGVTLIDNAGSQNATSNVVLAVDENSKVGTSHYFYTTSTYVGDKAVVPNSSAYSFPVGSSFSIVYWIKFTELDYNGQDHVIISKGNWKSGSPTTAFWSSGTNGSGKVNFLLQDSNGNRNEMETSTGGYNDGLWHQVVLVRDEAMETNYIYIDGTVRGQSVYNYTGNFTVSDDIQFANLLSGSQYSYFFRGSIDEVAIYNRALSSTEITSQITLANSGMGICDGLNPRISSIPKTTTIIGSSYTYAVRAGGVQTGMTYTLLTKPSGMTINSTTGLISWTPAAIDANGLVSVRADNGIAPADTQTFRIYLAEGTSCPNNLMVLLKLDESSGPIYADYYAAHNSTGSVSPIATSGIINGAQLFNTTTKMDIPDNATEFDWPYNASFSFECWLKTSATVTMVCMARHRLDYSNVAFWYVGTDQSNGSYAEFELRDNGGNIKTLIGTSAVNDGAWHHIIAVRDGTNNLNKLYVDGVEEASVYIYYTNSFIADVPTEVNVGYLHRAIEGEMEYHLEGSLDEIAIYNRAVSAAEASSFYNAGNPVGHCAAGNYAPVITSVPIAVATEEVAYSYTFEVDDIDAGDILTLSAVTKPSWLTFNWTAGQKTATLTGTPGSSHIGNHSITLGVSDGDVQINQSFTITVDNVYDNPVITSTPVTITNEDSPYSYTLTVTDADVADVINMSVVTKPTWLNFSYTAGAKTAILSGTPDDADIGTDAIDISITDGHATIHHTYNLTVNAVNDPPVITAQVSINTNEDVAIALQKFDFTITDVDNPLTDVMLKVQSGSNYAYVGNTVTPSLNFNGQLTVNIVASDLNNDSQPFHAIITVISVNDTPVVTSAPDLTGYVGNLYAYVFTATDVDDAILTKSIVYKPDWLSYSATSGVLSGIPGQADKGQHIVILRVSDGKVDMDQDFIITVDGPTALNDMEASGIRVYPVPAKEYLNIEFESLTAETQMEIIAVSGGIVKKAVIPANQAGYSLELSGIETGTYLLHLRNSKLNIIERITVAK